MGVKIDPEKDKIETSPELELRKQKLAYYAFHKPAGYICSMTGPEKPKITELLEEIPERVFPVGRLDKLTSGLLLLTNDGRFAYQMTHPKFEKEKEYIVKTREKITPQALSVLQKSLYIHGKKTRSAMAAIIKPHLAKIIIKEGRNRQIRRLCEKANLHIEKLKRIRIGGLLLGELPPTTYRKLSAQEISSLTAEY